MTLFEIVTMPLRIALVLIGIILSIPLVLIIAIISPKDTMSEAKEILQDVRRFIAHGV